ncbi:hypothetical protein B0H13DRAFT_1916032 [Mycena leptocephala]|nr:hypothetical protein B0H13DRAFT_1916032 [Mycena leptocephala]
MEEEVARLRKELAQSRQANTKLSSCSLSVPFAMALIHQYGNAEAALAKKSSRSRKLIPHPKGQAEGRRTIREQDPTMLAKVIIKVRNMKSNLKYFQRFRGGWPIRDFIKQHLRNSNDKFKRAVRQEKEAEAEDSDDWEDEETSDLEKAGAGGKPSSSRVAARDEGSEDEDVDIIPFDDEMDNILSDEPELEMDGLQDDFDLASEAEAEELIDDVQDARDVEELDHLTLEEANMPPSPSSPQCNEKENIPPSPKGPQSPPRLSAKVKGKGQEVSDLVI